MASSRPYLPYACQNPQCDKPSAKRLASERALTLHLHSSKKCREFMNAALATADKKGMVGSKGTSQEGPMVSVEFSTSQNPSKTLVRDFLNPYNASVSGPDSGQQHQKDTARPQAFFNGNEDGILQPEYNTKNIVGFNPFLDDLYASQNNNQPLASANNPCCYNKEMKWTVALLKLVDDLKAPDEAFGKILLWACNAAKDEYSFEPHAGLSRSNNVKNLFDCMENAKYLLPSVSAVPTTELANGPTIDVISFDFVPQLLSLLQNRSIMTQENVLIDFADPFAPYTSPNNCLEEAISGNVYKDAYKRLVTDPSRQLFVPIIQWIDRTHVTGNDRFTLKPYMFTPAIFKEKFCRTFAAWKFHGYLPKEKGSTAQNRRKKQGDNMRSYHAQLKEVLKTFANADSRLHNVKLPIGPNRSDIECDIKTCLLYVIQDIQEGDTLCCWYGPHLPNVRRHCRGCNVLFDELDDCTFQCEYLKAEFMNSVAQSNDPELCKQWSQHRVDNVFNSLILADPIRGIFGSTPTEIMHVVCGGLLYIISGLVLDNVPSGLKAKLDDLAKHFHENHQQTCRKMYPSTDFSNGITNLKKLTLTERHGLVFLFVILFLYDDGWDILDATLQEKTTTNLPKVINLFESILCFDAWI